MKWPNAYERSAKLTKSRLVWKTKILAVHRDRERPRYIFYELQALNQIQEDLENKMEELGIGQHLREGRGHYKSDATRDRGR